MSWPVAFLLTQLIEVPVYLLGLRGSALSPGWRVAVAVGASAVTHPAVWFVFPTVIPHVGWLGYFVLAEGFAVLAEWAYLRAFDAPRAGRLALVANATSASIGLSITALLRGSGG